MQDAPGAGEEPIACANILLVDDQLSNLVALKSILADLGQNLVTASSGEEALRLLFQDDFAVVLLDVQMRGLDGFATAQVIRSRERTRHTPIIFLTAYDSVDFPVERAYALGAVDYLVKPLLPAILRAKTAVFVDLFHKTERLRRLERREFQRRLGEAAACHAEEARGRRESERRSRQLAEFHRAVMASMGEGLYAIDTRGMLTYMNPAAERLLGWTAEELLGRSMHDSIHYKHPDDSPFPADQCALLRVQLDGSALKEHEDAFVRKDGTTMPVACSSSPIISDGAVAGAVVVFRDVTRQKQAEQDLRGSARRYRALADTMPQIVWAARPDGCLDYFNRRWYEFSGYPEGKSGDPSWLPILHPDDVAPCLEAWRQALQSGEPYQVEYRFMDRVTGTYRWHLGRALPVRDDAGRIDRWFGTCTDIDEQKRMEQGLREANAAKDQFLVMLAHELRNPLAPLLSTLFVLAKDEAVRQTHGPSLDRMERQLRRLNRMVDDLLEGSRVILGRIRLRSERLDLARLVRIVVEDHRPLLEQAGVTLTVTAPPTPVWVKGDADRLAQVLDNLLDNEAKFVDRGGSAAVVLTADSESSEAVLTFADTGIGFTPEMRDRLFDVFAQADQSLDRTRGGLGLGLAVVKGLMEQHGGTVGAASDGAGLGAKFTLRLALEPEPLALAATPEGSTAAGPRSRILVIEDHRDAAESLRTLLEILGHEVRVAFTGREGVEAALVWTPDVVLSDIGLPELDGYEVARRLRQEPSFANVLLVALTGYNGDDDRRRSKDAGFDHHLVKPADVRELQRVLTVRAS
ncbi:MAG TPA: hybrid sensor histidine kinase/response regulator [Planctomycetales bacterium]|jgi:PAS domain S-box-containing protein|nr:hybrid sensor histidine kinase/response regulator [Planctomycetales bacterium]